MALAFLCRQLEVQGRGPVEEGHDDEDADGDFTIKAFVVDHKAREESSREARTVAGWLREMGISTSILELEWPPSSSAFETHARRLRFQALGRACRDHGLDTLLLGHHRDDNVETTLWRLCAGARGHAGLVGIPSVARIPECQGLYGVAESGRVVGLRGRQVVSMSSSSEGRGRGRGRDERDERPPLRIDERKNKVYMDLDLDLRPQHDNNNNTTNPLPTTTGGILLCRPLLPFPKTRLIATCTANAIPFVTDPTNADPTLTPRNAIRSLLSSKRLPRALAAPSILSLIRRSRERVRAATAASDRLLRAGGCRVLEFDGRVGVMVVRFPSLPEQIASAASAAADDSQIQAMTLRRITELISPFPRNHFPLRSFEGFVGRVFPSKQQQQQHPPKTQRQAFTVGGVLFRPVVNTPTTPDPDGSDSNTWLLSRQPYMRHRLPEVRLDVPVPIPQQGPTSVYTPWTLWDHRFWFRLRLRLDAHDDAAVTDSAQTIPMVIRPLQPTDLHRIKIPSPSGPSTIDLDPDLDGDRFHRTLSRSAPGPVRFTLPVLVSVSGAGAGAGEQPLALPTLDMRVPGADRATGTGTVEWEWAYKMVDAEALRLMGWLEDVETMTPE
ncbi:hypothetical protein VTN02DRAFT_2093 [Thermoascus thermophilus]